MKDLFGESCAFTKEPEQKKTKHEDYEGFLEKFEIKKTTDDCYTPKNIYDAVLNFVSSKCDVSGLTVLRPFFPGGDYKSFTYSENSVVIDNPPFSIISEICRYYLSNGVKFFLFAPHMTLFSPPVECTRIVAGCDITYENGAIVKTSFISNLFGDLRVISCPEIYSAVKQINADKKANLPKYVYPENVLMVSDVQRFTENGINFELKRGSLTRCRALESQKAKGKGMFGSGFLLSNSAAAERAAAERAAAERAAAERKNVIEWALSEKELSIIESMETVNQ